MNIHRKSSILKNGKCTNFNMVMNVVLLVVCSPIFPAAYPMLSSCLEMCVVRWEELGMWRV